MSDVSHPSSPKYVCDRGNLQSWLKVWCGDLLCPVDTSSFQFSFELPHKKNSHSPIFTTLLKIEQIRCPWMSHVSMLTPVSVMCDLWHFCIYGSTIFRTVLWAGWATKTWFEHYFQFDGLFLHVLHNSEIIVTDYIWKKYIIFNLYLCEILACCS